MMVEAVKGLWFLWFVFSFLPTMFLWRHFPRDSDVKPVMKTRIIEANPDDYWDGGYIDYDTGEISTNTGPSVRHPKNRDRAYSGSFERFHDGGGQDS